MFYIVLTRILAFESTKSIVTNTKTSPTISSVVTFLIKLVKFWTSLANIIFWIIVQRRIMFLRIRNPQMMWRMPSQSISWFSIRWIKVRKVMKIHFIASWKFSPNTILVFNRIKPESKSPP